MDNVNKALSELRSVCSWTTWPWKWIHYPGNAGNYCQFRRRNISCTLSELLISQGYKCLISKKQLKCAHTWPTDAPGWLHILAGTAVCKPLSYRFSSLVHGAELARRRCHPASHEIPRYAWNPNSHPCVHKSQSLASVQSQLNPVHTVTLHIFQSHYLSVWSLKIILFPWNFYGYFRSVFIYVPVFSFCFIWSPY